MTAPRLDALRSYLALLTPRSTCMRKEAVHVATYGYGRERPGRGPKSIDRSVNIPAALVMLCQAWRQPALVEAAVSLDGCMMRALATAYAPCRA